MSQKSRSLVGSLRFGGMRGAQRRWMAEKRQRCAVALNVLVISQCVLDGFHRWKSAGCVSQQGTGVPPRPHVTHVSSQYTRNGLCLQPSRARVHARMPSSHLMRAVGSFWGLREPGIWSTIGKRRGDILGIRRPTHVLCHKTDHEHGTGNGMGGLGVSCHGGGPLAMGVWDNSVNHGCRHEVVGASRSRVIQISWTTLRGTREFTRYFGRSPGDHR